MRVITAALVVLLLLVPCSALAKESGVRYWELALPDMRYEFNKGFLDGEWTLSYPLLIAPYVMGLGEEGERVAGGIPGTSAIDQRSVLVLVPELVIEPQYNISSSKWRAVVGAKLYGMHRESGIHVAVEGLGVAGQDGHGGGVGLSLGYGTVASLAYRKIWTDEQDRHVLFFDVRLFVFPLSQPEKTLTRLRRLPAHP
jgi:hypothetical protein